MQEKHLFEYAVIRIVPHVEREEFLNAGVVLYCSRKKFLQVLFQVNEKKIRPFCGKLDIAEITSYMDSFERICKGTPDAGPIGKLTMAERFRWLTATRSTIVQSSKVHSGFCDDPMTTLERLYEQLVL
jgi:hypothetical protein